MIKRLVPHSDVLEEFLRELAKLPIFLAIFVKISVLLVLHFLRDKFDLFHRRVYTARVFFSLLLTEETFEFILSADQKEPGYHIYPTENCNGLR